MKILFILMLLVSYNSNAQTIHLTSGEFPPFVGSELKNGGLATEVISLIFNKLGDQATIAFRPWKRGYSETLSGKYVGTFPYSKNKEREKIFFYSDPIYQLEEHFFSRRSAKLIYNNDHDLTGLRICKPLGYNLFGLKKLSEDKVITLERPKNMVNCFKMLDSHRVDLVLTNQETGWKYIEQLFETSNPFSMNGKSFISIGHYFIVPKNNPQGASIIQKFNNTLDELKLTGEINAIRDKHIK